MTCQWKPDGHPAKWKIRFTATSWSDPPREDGTHTYEVGDVLAELVVCGVCKTDILRWMRTST